VPELGESISEGTISNWVIKEGDSVNEGDIILEIETDKVNLEVSAEHSGIVTKIKKQSGDTVEVGEVIALLNEDAQESTDTDSESPKNAVEEEAAEDYSSDRNKASEETHKEIPEESPADNTTIATPAARRRARERGVDIKQVKGTDPMGRISKEDINNSNKEKTPETGSVKQEDSKERKDDEAEDIAAKPVERQRMSRRRLTIANRLVEAQQTAAMLTTFNEVDMTAIMDLRRRRKEAFREKYNIGLGFMSFFTKAVVGALKAFPLINAEIEGEEILIKKFYDIGVAVSTDEGLIVPVVRDADKLSFAQIEQQINSLAEKARNRSLGLSEIQGGTFTITNGGVFGSLLSTPILNTPQVGILGMHKIQTRPVTVENDQMENRPMMYIALSYDHRIVDGSEAVRFLVRIKELLEDPETLLIEGS
jgi:2-oxoglutarate dehydrogenase E2 component (dihydrolipoamide succinyltransferase)